MLWLLLLLLCRLRWQSCLQLLQLFQRLLRLLQRQRQRLRRWQRLSPLGDRPHSQLQSRSWLKE